MTSPKKDFLPKQGGEMVVDFNVADDVALLADSWMVTAALVMKMEQVTQIFGINISAKKSEILYIGRGVSDFRVEDVQLIGQVMKTVEQFTYLGSLIVSNGKFTQDIERRRTGATRAFGILRPRLWEGER